MMLGLLLLLFVFVVVVVVVVRGFVGWSLKDKHVESSCSQRVKVCLPIARPCGEKTRG